MNKFLFTILKNNTKKLMFFVCITFITLNCYSKNYLIKNDQIINPTIENIPKIISTCDSIKKDSLFNKFHKNSIYAEFLGYSIFFGSLNYERLIFIKRNNAINVRIGFFAYPLYLPDWFVVIPLSVNYQLKLANKINFEIGAGTSIIFDGNSKYISILGNTGFRFQIRKNFLFKINFTPLFQINYFTREDIYKLRLSPWFGLSIGYSFGK